MRLFDDDSVGVSLDETVNISDLEDILKCAAQKDALPFSTEDLYKNATAAFSKNVARTSKLLKHPVESRSLLALNDSRCRSLRCAVCLVPSVSANFRQWICSMPFIFIHSLLFFIKHCNLTTFV